MKEPTQKQVKKFWEGCGFKFEEHDSRFEHWLTYTTPDEADHEWHKQKHYTGYPDLDFNNIFKWAVPKLDSLTDINLYRRGEEWKVELISYDIPSVRSINKDPTLALFWAIWKVIDG